MCVTLLFMSAVSSSDNKLDMFHRFSSYLILLPLLIIAVAMAKQVFAPPRPSIDLKSSVVQEPPQAEQGLRDLMKRVDTDMHATPSGTLATSTATLKSPVIDLKGPWTCISPTAQLYIKDQRAYAVLPNDGKKKQILLDDDCIYEWDETKEGAKQCGIKPFVGIVLPMFESPEGVEQLLSVAQSKVDTSEIRSLLRTCQKKDVAPKLLQPPVGVKWTEGALF
jgi:hypothetical protein